MKPAAKPTPNWQCGWSDDADGNWDTDCGNLFTFIYGGPLSNGCKFCLYCGKPLIEMARYE